MDDNKIALLIEQRVLIDKISELTCRLQQINTALFPETRKPEKTDVKIRIGDIMISSDTEVHILAVDSHRDEYKVDLFTFAGTRIRQDHILDGDTLRSIYRKRI
jgi:hypothetical protein